MGGRVSSRNVHLAHTTIAGLARAAAASSSCTTPLEPNSPSSNPHTTHPSHSHSHSHPNPTYRPYSPHSSHPPCAASKQQVKPPAVAACAQAQPSESIRGVI
ncbi:unnamed protein product [Closterium sp. NIES-54]